MHVICQKQWAPIKDAGLDCEMMTTDIVGTQNRRDYDLLALARSLGIKYYRLGVLRYDKNVPPTQTLGRYRVQLTALAEWNGTSVSPAWSRIIPVMNVSGQPYGMRPWC